MQLFGRDIAKTVLEFGARHKAAAQPVRVQLAFSQKAGICFQAFRIRLAAENLEVGRFDNSL